MQRRQRRTQSDSVDKDIRIIIPSANAIRGIGRIGIKFLDDYEIHIKGIIAEVLRLTTCSNARYNAEILQSLIDCSNFSVNWERLHNHVFPKFTREEAIDRWLTMVTVLYYQLEDEIRTALVDEFDAHIRHEIILKDVAMHGDDLGLVFEIDKLPF